MFNSILITRHLKPESLLKKWALEKNLELVTQPFIEINPIKNLVVPKTDWIFFSSPQGVEVYFENYTLNAKRVAALSIGTASELTKRNIAIDFIGDSKKSTEEIGQEFFKKVGGDEHVLFPLSSISLKKISAQGNSNQVIEWVCYETNLNHQTLNTAPEIIVFTSPSNVDGFLLHNEITSEMKLVAIGNTTKNHLEKFGYTGVLIPNSTEESDLIFCLEKIIQ